MEIFFLVMMTGSEEGFGTCISSYRMRLPVGIFGQVEQPSFCIIRGGQNLQYLCI
jgi:hypothetical protein